MMSQLERAALVWREKFVFVTRHKEQRHEEHDLTGNPPLALCAFLPRLRKTARAGLSVF